MLFPKPPTARRTTVRPDRPTPARRRRAGLGLLLAVTAAAVLLAGCGDLVRLEPHEQVTLPAQPQTSVVVDRHGEELAELHAEQDREVVEFDDLPSGLVDAVVAVEDHRCGEHRGSDAPGVLRALGINVREGRIVQGGSTITQQLAKISLVGADKTVERKISEAGVALQLEAQFTKAEILTQYLNTVYFGQGAYGAQTAARTYFGVDAADLDLGQAAMLAGLLRAPSEDNPLADPERAEHRRNLVLRRMAEVGAIDAAEAERIADSPLEVSPPGPDPWRAPYFVDHVLQTIQHDDAFADLGDSPNERAQQLYRGGLRIETTLDPGWQQAAEEAVAEVLSEDEDPHAAVVAMEPGGAVRAMVGGRDYEDPDDPVARLNLATKARRQPGSAFKPVTLAAAVARGHSLDEPWPAPASITIGADPPEEPRAWSLSNYDDTDFGQLDLRRATWYSVNTVYAQLADAVGGAAIADLAERAGVGRSLPPVRSISLGSVEVTPYELARVNATFAAGGLRHDARVVERIVGPDGEVVWEPPPSKGERVMDTGVAWLTTDVLRGVVSDGTGELVDLGDHAVAGKTGTTDDYADAWFAGYTPEMALSVWVGFPEGRVSMVPPRTRRRVEGGAWPAEIFHRVANGALDDEAPADFPAPHSSVITVEVDVSRGCLPNDYTPPGVIEERTYLAGTEPTVECEEPAGPALVTVPDVTGLSLAEAEDALAEAGFSGVERSRYAPEAEPGAVVDQTPRAGRRRLGSGRRIELWLATDDPEGVDVPDVLGLGAAEAVTRLERGGFPVTVERACPGGGHGCAGARERPGVVWQQDPSGTARAETTVELSVYPDRPEEPDADGDAEDAEGDGEAGGASAEEGADDEDDERDGGDADGGGGEPNDADADQEDGHASETDEADDGDDPRDGDAGEGQADAGGDGDDSDTTDEERDADESGTGSGVDARR
jgi:penicillin-binding protein 1A